MGNPDRSRASVGRFLVNLGKTCALLFLTILLLAVVGCQAQRYRVKQRVLATMPSAIARGEILALDICDPIFGGIAYIIRVPRPALTPSQLQQLPEPSDHETNPSRWTQAEWTPITGQWNYEGTLGLQCLTSRKVLSGRLSEHLYRPGGYVRYNGARGADYYVPSLGVVVGGHDPR